MNDLEKFAAHVKSFTVEEQEKKIVEVVLKHEAEIVDLNIGQMMDGKNWDGSDIEPEYRPLTIEIKKAKGQIFDRVTLRDEGVFHGKMYLEGDAFPLQSNSSDVKTGLLDEKYNADKFFGYSEQSKKTITQEVVKQDVQEYYKSIVKL